MASRVRVDMAAAAQADLMDILAWYDSKDAPDVGRRLAGDVVELVMPPFRIVYRRDDGVVTIVRIWRSERLMTLGADEAAMP